MYARLGRACFEHRRAVLLSWLAVFVVGIVVGGGVFGRLKDSNGGSSTESVKGFNILDDATGAGPTAIAGGGGAPGGGPGERARRRRPGGRSAHACGGRATQREAAAPAQRAVGGERVRITGSPTARQ